MGDSFRRLQKKS